MWDSYYKKYSNNEKEEYVYDANGNNTQYEYWYGEGSEWMKNLRIKKKFNDDNNETQTIVFHYNPGNSNWDTISIQHIDYNTAGMIVAKYDSTKQPYSTPPWQIKRVTHLYDNNNNDTTVIYAEWYESINDWATKLTVRNKFDGEHRLIETSSTDGIHYGNNIFYSYNSEGLLDTTKSYRPHQTGSDVTWKLWTRIDYAYTPEGWVSQESIWNYNQQKEDLEPTRQTLNTYNSNGDKLEIIRKTQNSQLTGFENNEKTVYEYDASFNLITDKYYKWFGNPNSWNLSTTKSYVFIDGVLRIEKYMVAGYNYPVSKSYYYYNGEVKTNAPINNFDKASIFPNPAHSNLTIQNPQLQYNLISLISTSGKLVLQRAVSGTTATINISKLDDGIYIAVLQGNADTKSFKIIKQ